MAFSILKYISFNRNYFKQFFFVFAQPIYFELCVTINDTLYVVVSGLSCYVGS